MIYPVILNGNNKRQKLNVIILCYSVLVQIESICLKQNKREKKKKKERVLFHDI